MGEEQFQAHTSCTRLGVKPSRVVDLAAGKNIAVALRATSFEQVRRAWREAVQAGTDLVEWRLDCLDARYQKDLAAVANLGIELRQEFGVPVLATWRTSREGGGLDVGAAGNRQQRFLGAEHYAELVLQAAKWADGVDVELQLSNVWPGGDLIAAVHGIGSQPSSSAEQVSRVKAGTSPDPVVVVSHHEFQVPPTSSAQLISILQAMSQTDADVLKIAWMVEDLEHLEFVCQAQKWAKAYLSHPTVLIAMGQAGAASRLGEVGAASAFSFATVGDDDRDRTSGDFAQGSADAPGAAEGEGSVGVSSARLGQLSIAEVRKSWLPTNASELA